MTFPPNTHPGTYKPIQTVHYSINGLNLTNDANDPNSQSLIGPSNSTQKPDPPKTESSNHLLPPHTHSKLLFYTNISTSIYSHSYILSRFQQKISLSRCGFVSKFSAFSLSRLWLVNFVIKIIKS